MLAREADAVYLRIDTIEQALRHGGRTVDGPEGYSIAYGLAADNLKLGRVVVADSVNPLEVTRQAWREVGERCGAPFMEIEVVCSAVAEHRRRVEERSTDVPDLRLPSWAEVVARRYDRWDRPHVTIDTAGQSEAESFAALRKVLAPDITPARYP